MTKHIRSQFSGSLWLLAIFAAMSLLIFAPGCTAINAPLATRVRAHIAPMKPVYDQGVATYPGATDTDRAIYARSWTELERLLDQAGAATQPAK